MKLKRLIIQGFKSFKDRTVINFDDGITGIVGPNGCGKSNIVDALFWVMGEQSAKHLRGSTMKDVIFSGSSKYNPSSWAEATLVLENNDGKHIHIGQKVSSPSEIQLTRKLYRNGETDYRINGHPARLRDIQEVFMDTGAGAKSYSIIAQGEINKLVQAKPQERRVMIEEVAGITKFKMRKRESLKKIDATQLNLDRLSDLQIEIEKNLRSLQKQAEKAERARSLKDKIRRNELVVNSHKVYDDLKNYRDGSTSINEKNLSVEGWKTRKDLFEIGLEDERFKKDEKTEKIEELQKDYNEISKELAAAEERLTFLCKGQTDKESLIAIREKEIEEIKNELENRSERLDELESSLSKLNDEASADYDFCGIEEKVCALKDDLEIKSSLVEKLNEEISEQKEEQQKVEQTIFRNNTRLEEFAASLQDTTEEIEVLEKQYSGVSTELVDERSAVNTSKELEEKLTLENEKLKELVEKTSLDYRQKEATLLEKQKSHIQMESKLISLKEINASLEGIKEGASEFLKTTGSENFSLLGALVQCDEKYTKPVAALVEQFLDMLVTSENNIAEFQGWLKSNGDQGLDLLIAGEKLNNQDETIERLKLNGCDDLLALSEVINIPDAYKKGLTALFEGMYVVSHLDDNIFNKISNEMQFKAIVSLDGKTLIRNVGGAKILSLAGESDVKQGIVERNNKIVDLETSVTAIAEEIEVLLTENNKLRDYLEETKNQADEIRNNFADARADYAAKKSGLDSKLANFETGNARLDILKNRKNEVSKQRLDLMESEEELTLKLEVIVEQLDTSNQKIEVLDEELQIQKASYSDQKEELMQKQVEAKSFEDRLKAVESQIEDVQGQIERQNARLASNNDLVEKYNQEIEQVENELGNLEQSNQDMASKLQDQEEVLGMLKDDLVGLLQSMQEREDEVKQLSIIINSTEKEVVEIESKLGSYLVEEEQIVRNIFEKYQIDLRYALGEFLEYEETDYEQLSDISSMYWMETENGPVEIDKEDYQFSRRYGQDLKDCDVKFRQYKTEFNRLGEINWQAIEDYERQKLRFDFLKEQEVELKKSLEDLEAAILHIDEKSKVRFKVAYDEVNMRFEKVFPIIFGGGSARLNINGDINDAECGIEIIAQPPGKKMQNINLMSGGEKALTAVSLIFSIFLVKPSPFCLLDEVDAPLDDANVGRFNELLREMSDDSQFILITHNKKTMELNDTLYGVTMQEPGVSTVVSVQLH